MPFLVCQPVSSPLCAPPKLVLLHFRTFSRGMCYTQSTICFPRSISSTIRSWILNWLLYAFCVDYLKLVHAFRSLLTHEFPTVRAPVYIAYSLFLDVFGGLFPISLCLPHRHCLARSLINWSLGALFILGWLSVTFNAFLVVLPWEFPTMPSPPPVLHTLCFPAFPSGLYSLTFHTHFLNY